MKIGDFIKDWNTTKLTVGFLSRAFFLSMAGNLLLTYGLVFQKETIIKEPPMSGNQKIIFKENWASESYHIGWGMFLANTFGNVTPKNVDFVKDIVGPLSHPSIYNDVIIQLQRQAEEIKRERVSKTFELSGTLYEASTGKVFIEGKSFTKGYYDVGKPQHSTYEFIMVISNYQPTLMAMNWYPGPPRTEEELKRTEDRTKRGKK